MGLIMASVKTTILAALFNALILIAAVGGITWEALQRLTDPAGVANREYIVLVNFYPVTPDTFKRRPNARGKKVRFPMIPDTSLR